MTTIRELLTEFEFPETNEEIGHMLIILYNYWFQGSGKDETALQAVFDARGDAIQLNSDDDGGENGYSQSIRRFGRALMKEAAARLGHIQQGVL